jgi:CubicO group peptidase (beta-lactamase class C family)
MISFVGLLAFTFLQGSTELGGVEEGCRELVLREPTAVSLVAGVEVCFRFFAAAGDRVEGLVSQTGGEVDLVLRDQAGEILAEFSRWNRGVEPFRFLAAKAGVYLLDVRPVGEHSGECQVFLGMVEPEANNRYARASQVLKRVVDDGPGMVVAFIEQDKLVFNESVGLADLAGKGSLTMNSLFPATDLSRQFNAFAIYKLIQEGQLALDQEVQDILPDFPPFSAAITIEQLLRKRSGLRGFSSLFQLREGDWSVEPTAVQIATLLDQQRELNFTPGVRSDFNDSAEFVLQAVVAQVTGVGFKQWMEEQVFKTLGMKTAVYGERGVVTHGLVSKYQLERSSWVSKKYECVPLYYPVLSMHDWVQWTRALKKSELDHASAWDFMEEMGIKMSGSYCNGMRLHDYPEQHAQLLTFQNFPANHDQELLSLLPDILVHDGPWPLEPMSLQRGRGVGIGGGRDHRDLPPPILKELEGNYYSQELDLDLELRMQGETLYALHPKGVEIKLEPSRFVRKTMLARSSLMQTVSFSQYQDGHFQEIRVGGAGYRFLVFHRQ